MPNIYDIAKRAGVSVTTVSKALNNYSDISEKTRKKIHQISEEMGYRANSVARSLSMKRSWTIGVFFNDFMNSGFKHPFFMDIMESFKKVVGENGYDILFIANHHIGGKRVSYVNQCYNRNADGLFTLSLHNDDPFLTELTQSNIPCISFDLDIIGKRLGYITSENIQGQMEAVEYLYQLGHRKIANIAAPFRTLTGHHRYLGYKQAIEKLGITYRSDYVVIGDYYIESGYVKMKELLRLPEPPTAVVTAADLIAIGAMKAVQEEGLSIPDDISIIGFDDIDLCQHVSPGLTTVRQDKQLLGKQAAEALLRLIEEPDTIPPVMTIPTDLVIRGSCTSPKR